MGSMGTTGKSPEEESSVDEMMEKFDEIMEQREQSLKPHEVTDQLPAGARIEDGNLVKNDSRPERDTIGFTPKRRKVIKCINEGMSPKEISKQDIASHAHISRTKREFGFLLENPMLYDAFVERPTKTSKDYKLTVTADDEEMTLTKPNEQKATAAAERLLSNGWSKVRLEYPDGDVTTYGKRSLEPASEPDSTKSVDEDGNESKDGKSEVEEVSEQDDDPFTYENTEDETIINEDGYKAIVGALYRDENDELAGKVIDIVWGDN